MTRAGALLSGAMLIIVAALYWLPTHVADALGWQLRAMEYVVGRIELAALWIVVALAMACRPWARPAAPVAVWAAAEAGIGAAARLALPMCCPLTSDARPLAVQAWGPAAEWASAAMAGAAVWWVAASMRRAELARHDHAAG